MYHRNEITIDSIQKEYEKSVSPWYLGFSGGKDSSAVLTLVFNALLELNQPAKPITILYCATGVEIPLIKEYVATTLEGISREARNLGLPIQTLIIEPTLHDRFFAKMIGRGYPPPTNKFRWCTKRLQIKPIKSLFHTYSADEKVLLLGVRQGESQNRDRSLARYGTTNRYFFRQARAQNTLIFAPIIDYTVEDVWATLDLKAVPVSIDTRQLSRMYKQTEGRLGCWTCTVVRSDRAMKGLIEQGHPELAPLLQFKTWLMEMRDNPSNRCAKRRNGQPGPGPLTLAAREEILRRLLNVQTQTGLCLISDMELELIERLWESDKTSHSYFEQ